MEEFKKLNWTQPLEVGTSFVTADELKSKSMAYRVLNNSFKTYLSSDSSDEPYEEEVKKPEKKPKKKKKAKKTNAKSVQKPELNKNGIRYSAFTASQHATYLELLLSVQNQMAIFPLQYSAMKEGFESEQKEFQENLKSVWMNAIDKHYILPEDAQKYGQETWKMQMKRVKSYPQFYKFVKNTPLVYPSDYPDVHIVPVKMLLEMGIVPKLHIPNINLSPKISTNYTHMLLLNAPKPEDADSLFQKTVSMDRNAECLALKERANIVISSSALNCFADNISTNYNKVWTVPFVIKQYKIKDDTSVFVHNVVFIDKKLPSKYMTASEKNAHFHKHAVKSFLCHPGDPLSFRYPENDIDFTVHILEDGRLLSKNEIHSKNVQICSDCKAPMQKNDTKSISSSPDDSDSGTSLVIDMEITESSKDANFCKCESSANCEGKENEKDYSDLPIPPPSKSNVTYRLWKLNCEGRNKEDLSEGLLKRPASNQELRILVRCKMDACENDNGKIGPVCLSSKMEFQAEHGVEKLNLSSLVRDWVKLLFRPEAILNRIRINAINEEIVMTEKCTLRDLTLLAASQFDLRIKRRIVGSLYQVMSDLTTLKPGHYLLSHDIRNGSFINILKESDENEGYNLYAEYESVNHSLVSKETTPPWTPIDVNVITPKHIASKHVPATFEPCK